MTITGATIKTITIATTLTALASIPAFADPGCSGCNVADLGLFGRQMVGYTAYYEEKLGDYTPARILDVDAYSRRVKFRDPYGQVWWAPAADIYTAQSKNERTATAIGVGLGITAMVCIMNPDACR